MAERPWVSTMLFPRPWRVLSFFLPLLPSAGLAAQRAEDFRRGLDAVSALMQATKWEDASNALAALLKAHHNTDHARHARSEIELVDKRCRFSLENEAPDPRTLISGEIRAFRAQGSSIRLRYTPGTLEDFADPSGSRQKKKRRRGADDRIEKLLKKMEEQQRKLKKSSRFGLPQPRLLLHPAVFKNCKITVKGRRYSTARFLVCLQGNGHYDITVGTPPTGSVYYPTRIVHVQGGERKELVDKHWGANEKPSEQKKGRRGSKRSPLRFPMKVGERYSVVIQVGYSDIKVQYKGRTIASVRKRPHEHGSFGFAVSDFETLEISGTVDPAWLQGAQDAAVQERFAAFEKAYQPRQHLPGWLFGATAKVAKAAARSRKPYPGDKQPGDAKLVASLLDALRKGSHRMVIVRAKLASERALPTPARHYFVAAAHHGLGDLDEALVACDKLCEADPEFAPGRALRGAICSKLGHSDRPDVEFRATLELDAELAEGYEAYAGHLLRTRRADAAQKILDRAKVAGVRTDALAGLGATVLKIRRGPNWPRSFRFESKHYAIASDIDEQVCRIAARVLESALKHYQARFGRLEKHEGPRFRVYVFSGRAGFDAYCKGLFGTVPVHTSGLYSPILKQLLIWNVPSQIEMFRTIRHEGFHQYLDSLLGALPPWLNEGLAEYFEQSRSPQGIPADGLVQLGHLAILRSLKNHERLPLDRLTRLRAKPFYGNTRVTYPMSWALVHFLRRGKKEHRQIFDAFIAGLRAGKGYTEVWRDALGGVDLDRLEAEFWNYVATLEK